MNLTPKTLETMKKQFKVTTHHTVFIDSYENGEGKQVNFYTIDSEVKAETPREAIENHFNNVIYLPFDFNKAEISEDKECIFWSCLVDEDNGHAQLSQIEKWKKGEKELYSNNIEIMVSEIIPTKFD